VAISRWETPDTAQAGPLDVMAWFDGPPVPDPITFMIGEDWLDKPNLYPRQATLIKIIFLRDDLFTEYDRRVIAEWQQRFIETNPDAVDNKFDARTKGLQPDLFERIAYLKARGYRWFPELIIAIGRRGSKGYLSALCMAYVLWNYLSKGNPQEYYGIDSNKPLACAVFAGKKQQAIENLWGDLYSVLTTAPCFTSYISEAQVESLTIYAPYDFVRMHKLAQRGIASSKDMATFRVVPRESTPIAPRGPAGCILAFDEAAHVKNAGVTREFGVVYCLVPTTKVLCSDLTWKQLKDVDVGQTLIALDEHTEPGKYRRLREAKILNKWATRGPALKLTFDDGSHVTCSPTHRWLKIASRGNYWCPAGLTPDQRDARGHHSRLKVGDKIRFVADPWEFDETREAGYLAGIYDGEGWISPASGRAIKIGFAQKHGMVLDRAVEALRERGFVPRIGDKARSNQVTDVYVCGQAEVLRLLGSIRPSRLIAKARRLWEDRAMANTTIDGGRISKTIVSIEDAGDQDLIDIETSTGTFIAEGLVSHNSAAKPSLDQFGTDGFVVLPSSTWEMIGKFYELWELSLQREQDGEDGEYVPAYPDKFMVQLESWAIYEDWELAPLLPLFPEGFTGDLDEYDPEALPRLGRLKGAIQAYDEGMAREEKANPDTFAVERRSDWATAMDAYLNAAKIDAMFEPWTDRLPENGRPELVMQTRGPLSVTYTAHGDPSSVNCRFGLAVAHTEHDDAGLEHAVFDLIHFWDPADFEDHTIDYDEVRDWIFGNVITRFMPDEMTFDQFNSVASVQALQKKVRGERLPKNIVVYERTATAPLNWMTWETFKAALNMGFVHSPAHAEAKDELRFVQKPEGVQKVVPASTGPVQTKDIADCIAIVTARLLGEQMKAYLAKDLKNQRPHVSQFGGQDALDRFSPEHMNPYAASLGVPSGIRGGLARGMRPAPVGRGGRTGGGRLGMSPLGARRHRS
jgi:LAGLIDADG-like domain